MKRLAGGSAHAAGLVALAALLLISCDQGPRPPVDGASMAATVSWIAGRHPSRMAGGAQERATAAWFARSLRNLGIEVEVEAFPVTAFSCEKASFALEGSPAQAVVSFLFSPPCPKGGIEAELLDSGWGLESDLSAARGRIVILHRRGTGLLEVAEEAARAGALGILVLDPGRPSRQGFAGPVLPLPMAELGGEEAAALALALRASPGGQKARPARGRLILETAAAQSKSHNVIGRIPGTGGGGRRLLVGAHLDSVDAPGAEDNASGLACLLSVAQAVSRQALGPDVYIVGFGAEEVGELGSKALVEAWAGREPGAVLILDTVGSGRLTMVYSLRAEANAVTLAAAAAAAELGLGIEGGGSENSDHLPFSLAGIPSAFFMRLPEERRHTALDRPEFIQAGALEETRALALATLKRLASSP